MGNLLCKKKYRIVPIVLMKGSREFNNDECSICLLKFNNDNYQMPCKHNFHQSCILDWFDKKKNCPLCRQPFKWIWDKNVTNNRIYCSENLKN